MLDCVKCLHYKPRICSNKLMSFVMFMLKLERLIATPRAPTILWLYVESWSQFSRIRPCATAGMSSTGAIWKVPHASILAFRLTLVSENQHIIRSNVLGMSLLIVHKTRGHPNLRALARSVHRRCNFGMVYDFEWRFHLFNLEDDTVLRVLRGGVMRQVLV